MLKQAHVKPLDIVLICGLILCSFLPHFLFIHYQKQEPLTNDNARYAVIRIDGKEVDRFNLDTQKNMEKTYHPTDEQYNIIQIKDGKIRVREDNSPDQIAVKTGWISTNGETSICLPHKLVIEVQQKNAKDAFVN
ncbi:NusG domain II-containing protein [Enterococcus saccharolyticus]|uniref:NusG domain II-containing protein n=1 Tax=Enterococcus TaxID=1350 RepID=UPI001E55560C|nr:NusG domain II-containing protein [Enterococcus saccharolyticus]MCD5002655.1 NusG domain II-containing protein [Enterococcus saccharolyticus]